MADNTKMSAQVISLVKVDNPPSELVLVMWQDGHMIATIKITHQELASSGHLEEVKAEIRSSMLGFHFEKVHGLTQCNKYVKLTSPKYLSTTSIIVKAPGKCVTINCESTDTVNLVKSRIEDKTNILLEQQRLIFNGHQLDDGRTLTEYGIQNNSIVYVVIRIRSKRGPYKVPVDLCVPQVYYGKGVEGCKDWECFLDGFNLLGHCTSSECISKGEQICIRLGLIRKLTLMDTKNIQRCPACHKAPIDVKTFLVSTIRAKITFRKTFNKEIKTLILEAPSNDSQEYAILMPNKLKQNHFSHDYIEITTVSIGMSFEKCQRCNASIMISEETVTSCGRAFHQKCLTYNRGCSICHLPELALNEVPEIVSSNLDKHISIAVPNHLFGKCSAINSENGFIAKPFGEFLTELMSIQFEALKSSKIPIIELQQCFVVNNLPYLIKHTSVTTDTLEKLRELKIISSSAAEDLSGMENEIDKTRELYKLVTIHTLGISAMIKVLGKSGQHRPALNLSMFETMTANYSKMAF